MPPADNPHNADSSEPVYDNPEGVIADFPMPYYSYPALGGPVSEEYDSPFESSPHINYTILNDANFMAQDPSTVVYSHSFEAEPNQTVKMEIDPPCEGLGSLMSWDSFMSISSLNMGTAHGHLWPSSLLSDPFSSVSGLDMIGGSTGCILGEVGLEQIYSTYSPALEKDEQDFSSTAEAMRMQTLVPDGFGLQSPIGDQQSEGRTDEEEEEEDDDNGDGGDFVMIMMMKDQMEAEEEGMGNQEEAMGAEEEWMSNPEEMTEVKEEEGMDNNQEGKAEQAEMVHPIDLLRQQLLEERLRNPEPNWGPYRPSREYLAIMRHHIQALENRLLLSRAGWSAQLLEELFGSNLLNGQWLPPPPPPPPPSN